MRVQSMLFDKAKCQEGFICLDKYLAKQFEATRDVVR